MAFRAFRSQSVSTQGSHNLAEKTIDDHVPSKVAQSTVTCLYQANVAGFWRNVSILWCKNLMNHSLHITIDSVGGDTKFSCKIDVKSWPFWSKKGYKTFEVEGNQVEVYWDLRNAKFSGSPEPSSDYYVALISDEEVVLLLGDYKKKAYKRTKSRPALVDAVLLVKKENVFAKKSFVTKAKFDEKRKENEIVVDSLTNGGPNVDPEMWITVDGVALIHVKNLQWKFRGNQTVMVNKQPVQVFWDVHDWLFSGSGSGPGLFIFKPGPVEAESEKEGSVVEASENNDDASVGCYSSLNGSTFEFCLILYAYKIE